jgi:cob(I)alamin adenosyltransferase
VRIYTRKGDDGTTGLLFGGRVSKSSPQIELNGAVDEAQAALGIARAESDPESRINVLLVSLEGELYTLMAEVATAPKNRSKLEPGRTRVTQEMVGALEARIDDFAKDTPLPPDFVIPGQNRCAAGLDLARTIIRRAERLIPGAVATDSLVGPYLNRLSDLVWIMARAVEGTDHLYSRQQRPTKPAGPGKGTKAVTD